MHNLEENKEQYQRKMLLKIKEINALHQKIQYITKQHGKKKMRNIMETKGATNENRQHTVALERKNIRCHKENAQEQKTKCAIPIEKRNIDYSVSASRLLNM